MIGLILQYLVVYLNYCHIPSHDITFAYYIYVFIHSLYVISYDDNALICMTHVELSNVRCEHLRREHLMTDLGPYSRFDIDSKVMRAPCPHIWLRGIDCEVMHAPISIIRISDIDR